VQKRPRRPPHATPDRSPWTPVPAARQPTSISTTTATG